MTGPRQRPSRLFLTGVIRRPSRTSTGNRKNRSLRSGTSCHQAQRAASMSELLPSARSSLAHLPSIISSNVAEAPGKLPWPCTRTSGNAWRWTGTESHVVLTTSRSMALMLPLLARVPLSTLGTPFPIRLPAVPLGLRKRRGIPQVRHYLDNTARGEGWCHSVVPTQISRSFLR